MDLTDKLGFEADLDLKTGAISFGDKKPEIVIERAWYDLHAVLALTNPHGSTSFTHKEKLPDEDLLVHRIYRFIGDTPEIEATGLKFDVTVVLPGSYSGEFPKTTGHYHLPLAYDNGTRSPDFYQIVYGKGVVLLQREDRGGIEASLVRPDVMQHLVVPPWMGHLTINTGNEPLVFANICIRRPHTNYEPFLGRHGAAYYLFNGENGEVALPNPHPGYERSRVASLLELLPSDPSGVKRTDPFYPILRGKQEQLRFLTRPSQYTEFFVGSLTPKLVSTKHASLSPGLLTPPRPQHS